MKKLFLSCAICLLLASPVSARGLPDAKAGVELAAAGLDEIAIKSFKDALADKSLSPLEREKTYYNMGTVQLRAYNPKAALASFDAALKIAPDETRTLINRAEALRMMGKHQEALRTLDRALALNANLPDADYARGLNLLALGKDKEAEAALRTALRGKSNPHYTIALGRALLMQKKFEEAVDVLDDAVDEDRPDLAYAYLYRSAAYHGLGKKRKSGDDLIRAVKAAPDDRTIRTIYEQRRFGKVPVFYQTRKEISALASPKSGAPIFMKIPKDMTVEASFCDQDGWCRIMFGSHLVGYAKKGDLKEIKIK